MLAALGGHTNIVSVLIAARANLNAVNQYGDTALMAAASNGHIDIVSVLIAARAEVNTANQYGYTALTAASVATLILSQF
jgi:ankyrin repeat protein